MLASVGLKTEQRSVSEEFLSLTSPPSYVRLEQREFDVGEEGDVADACLRRAQSSVKARAGPYLGGDEASERSLSPSLSPLHRSGRLARGVMAL